MYSKPIYLNEQEVSWLRDVLQNLPAEPYDLEYPSTIDGKLDKVQNEFWNESEGE